MTKHHQIAEEQVGHCIEARQEIGKIVVAWVVVEEGHCIEASEVGTEALVVGVACIWEPGAWALACIVVVGACKKALVGVACKSAWACKKAWVEEACKTALVVEASWVEEVACKLVSSVGVALAWACIEGVSWVVVLEE